MKTSIRRAAAALGIAATLALTGGTAAQVATAGSSSETKAEAYTDVYPTRCVYIGSYSGYISYGQFAIQVWRDYTIWEEWAGNYDRWVTQRYVYDYYTPYRCSEAR